MAAKAAVLLLPGWATSVADNLRITHTRHADPAISLVSILFHPGNCFGNYRLIAGRAQAAVTELQLTADMKFPPSERVDATGPELKAVVRQPRDIGR